MLLLDPRLLLLELRAAGDFVASGVAVEAVHGAGMGMGAGENEQVRDELSCAAQIVRCWFINQAEVIDNCRKSAKKILFCMLYLSGRPNLQANGTKRLFFLGFSLLLSLSLRHFSSGQLSPFFISRRTHNVTSCMNTTRRNNSNIRTKSSNCHIAPLIIISTRLSLVGHTTSHLHHPN